ncbi:hypothetical protein OAK06_08460 [Gammaproteobacteria bacterium]|nr:hypothetical protein [Gammaproteobacteria bacterium]
MNSLFDKAKQYFGMTAIQQATSKEIEYLLYERVAEDIEQGFRDKGVWTKAFVEAEGDEGKTKAKYIALMVLQMQLQIKAGLELQELFSEVEDQQEPERQEPERDERESFEDYIPKESNEPDTTYEEVFAEMQKQKDKVSRELNYKFIQARKDLNLKD